MNQINQSKCTHRIFIRVSEREKLAYEQASGGKGNLSAFVKSNLNQLVANSKPEVVRTRKNLR